ncbi:MAG: protein-glutamate O-methyltransferase CheR [Calditrichaeota bacterium]|nr:MAG: protein-glutamate O-methyltransferase CheR [Calditrichota bacterium]
MIGNRTSQAQCFSDGSVVAQKAPADIDPASFKALRDLLYELSGIYLNEKKAPLLHNRLAPVLKEFGLPDYQALVDQLKASSNKGPLVNRVLDSLVVAESSFFRNKPQLKALVNSILPELFENARQSGRGKLRILSAGCSSGEEPYTLAILLKHHFAPQLEEMPVELTGIDISARLLEQARKAEYPEFLLRDVPEDLRRQYFQKVGLQYTLVPEIREMVRLRQANLLDGQQLFRMGHFDLILCRNVLLYFHREAKIQTVNALYNMLYPQGYLLVGYSESLHGISRAFEIVLFPKAISYKKTVLES